MRPIRVIVFWPFSVPSSAESAVVAAPAWVEAIRHVPSLGAPLLVCVVTGVLELRDLLEGGGIDALVVPLSTARESEVLDWALRNRGGDTIAVVLLGDPDSEAAREALQGGAQDVVPPPGSPAASAEVTALARSIRHAVDRTLAHKEMALRQARLERIALMDALTETYNRHGFERFLHVETGRSRRTGLPLHAAILDLDNFKSINERYGHAGGDQVLMEIAARVVRAVRSHDHVARIGGDEFVVLLPDTRRIEAAAVAERVRSSISDASIHLDGGREVAVTGSLGVFEVSPWVRNVTELLRDGGEALHLSKAEGKNRVHLSTAEPGPPRETQPELSAIRWRDVPIQRISDGAVVAIDMVGGWSSDGHGEMRPHYIELAQRQFSRMARAELDLEVLRQGLSRAAEAASSHGGDGLATWIFVHCLPSTLSDSDYERLESLPSPDPSVPKLLITMSEQQMSGDPGPLSKALEALRERGFGVAVDDVGFGRGSLESLIALDPDVARLHPRLVRGVAASPAKAQILNRLVRSVRALRIEVVARGVASLDDCQLLMADGIHFAQGDLWSCGDADPQGFGMTGEAEN